MNDERDVLIATVRADDDERDLAPGDVHIVEKGRRRAITAGAKACATSPSTFAGPPLQIHPRRKAG